MKVLKSFSIIGFMAVMTLCMCGIALADIVVSPVTNTVQVSPGGRHMAEYTVANRSDKPVTVNVSARTWFSLPENSQINIEDWLNLGTPQITIGPNRKNKVEVAIDVPKEAVGELAGMIYFAPKREKDQTIGTSYGVSLYVFVQGTEVIDPQIGDISISRNGDRNYLAVKIENKGNIHFRPRISAVVTAGDVREEVSLPFGKPIFGGQSHIFVEEIKTALPLDGSCSVDVSCNYANSADTVLSKTVTLDLSENIQEE